MRKDSTPPKVSVIIPVYNCQAYLQDCLDSIYRQTFKDYEIIAINDGSTDQSLSILKDNAKAKDHFNIIEQNNQGQGRSRNSAIDVARGEYIQFIDADDWIEPDALALAVARANKDKADVVHYQWRYSDFDEEKLAAYRKANPEPFSSKPILKDSACDELLLLRHYISMNNLYRKSFLNKYHIRYGEGRIYEDNIFMALVANRATTISFVHETLYIYRRNQNSSTNTGYKDDRHGSNFIKAINETLPILQPRTPYTAYYLAKYFQTKFIRYYTKRVPFSYKYTFLKQYVDAMADLKIEFPPDAPPERILRLCLKRDIFRQHKYLEFQTYLYYKTVVLPFRDRVKNVLQTLQHTSRRK